MNHLLGVRLHLGGRHLVRALHLLERELLVHHGELVRVVGLLVQEGEDLGQQAQQAAAQQREEGEDHECS